MTDPFDNVIGQDGAIEDLRFHLEGVEHDLPIPVLGLIAPKGCGKTMLATIVSKHLRDTHDRRHFDPINCSTLGSVADFIEEYLAPNLDDKFTLIFDEASEIPKPISMFLLTLLDVKAGNTNTMVVDGRELTVDFRRHTFIFATSEPHTMFHALLNRFERIQLTEYTRKEMEQILLIQPDVSLSGDRGMMTELVSLFRGDAREVVKWGKKIVKQQIISGRGTFGSNDWREWKIRFRILPLGLNKDELKILVALNDRGEVGASLTRLASVLGSTAEAVRVDYESYLLKLDFMDITRRGRVITERGKKYLTTIPASAIL